MVIDYGLYLGANAKPNQGINEASTTLEHPLGAFFDDQYGRRFRYSLNGAGALVAGNIVQGAALAGATTTLQGTAAVAVASEAVDTRIYITALTTAQAANLFKNGWAAVWDVSATTVYTRRVEGCSALAASGVASYIDLAEALPVALTTDDKMALSVNPFSKIIVTPTTITGKILGGVGCAVAAESYCWVQTKGIFGVWINDATTNVGANPLTYAGVTAGSLIDNAEQDSVAVIRQMVANSMALWLDGGVGLVDLTCE